MSTKHLQHVRSNEISDGKAKLPTSEQILEGELAVNYAKGYETISMKNDAGEIITFSPYGSSGSINVLQETGNSTTDTMSQKAITDELNKKADSSALGDYVKESEINTVINNAISGKADKTELTTLFDGAEYTKGTLAATQGKDVIAFKHGTTVLAEIDATDFIKDGMVESVELTGGKLVITWNTASGKTQPTEIEVSDIFNADNYYTKEVIDGKLDGKVDSSTYTTDKNSINNSITRLEDGKADKATTIAGYGITDAFILSSTVTLGSVSISPVTDITANASSNIKVTKMKTLGRNDYQVDVEDGFTIPSDDIIRECLNKQDSISDLGTIRSNATNGNTAYGWGNHATAGYLKGSVRVVNVTSNLTNQTTSIAAGGQETVFYSNNTVEHTVAIATNRGYKTPDGEALTLTIPPNGYGEVNFMNVGGTIYVRGL